MGNASLDGTILGYLLEPGAPNLVLSQFLAVRNRQTPRSRSDQISPDGPGPFILKSGAQYTWACVEGAPKRRLVGVNSEELVYRGVGSLGVRESGYGFEARCRPMISSHQIRGPEVEIERTCYCSTENFFRCYAHGCSDSSCERRYHW